MSVLSRKNLVASLPYSYVSDDALRKQGLVPRGTVRDIIDTFVSRVEDSPALLDRSQSFEGVQSFQAITAGNAEVGNLVIRGGVSFATILPQLTAANLAPLSATYGEVEQGVLENLRSRVLELESTLVVYGMLPRRIV